MKDIEPRPLKVLFLCTGNSTRSIFAEYLMRRIGQGRFDAHSAGSDPTGRVNPFAIKVLQDQYQMDAGKARSKSWDEFKDTQFDIVITVCDRARETSPIFPGHPIVAHWSIVDPALATGSDLEKIRQYRDTAQQIQRRIELLCPFPREKLRQLIAEYADEAEI